MLKLESEGQLPFKRNRQKLYAYTYAVNNWNVVNKKDNTENGHRIKALENEAKKILLTSFGDKANLFTVSTNVLYYDKITLGTGRQSIMWIGYRMSKSVSFSNLYFAPIKDSMKHLLIRKIILRVEKVTSVLATKKRIFAKTDDKHNDCVFKAILKAYNYDKDMMPEKINNPKKFKKFFNVGRDDGIPIFEIVDDLQTMLKSSIVIVGKKSYTPKQILPRNITLKYDNEHVTLMNNKGKTSTAGISFTETSPDNVYTIAWNNNATAIIYNGKKTTTIDNEEYEALLKSNIKFVKVRTLDANLEEERDKFIRKAKYFNKTTGKLVNFFRGVKHSQVSFEMWRQLSKHISEPEPLEPFEHIPLQQANKGGVHHAKEGIYKHCTDYDMNMMYQYYLSHNNFTFPMRKPDYVGVITTAELKSKKFLQYGLYKCAINKGSIWIPEKCADEFTWLPHYILMIAINEKVDIEMCDDGEANIILYTSNRVNGNIAFGEFTERLYKIKQDAKDTEFEEDAKLLTSSFWGYLASKTKHYKTFDKDAEFDEDDFDIIEERPLDDGSYRLTYTDKVEKLKFAYARISTFLTGYCRYQLYKTLQDNGISNDSIVTANTDGIVLRNGVRLPDKLIGTEAGKFKIAKKLNKKTGEKEIVDDVKVEVKNSNSYFIV